MFRLTGIGLLLGGLLAVFAIPATAGIVWRWEDRFSEADRSKLQSWIRSTVDAVERRVAPYPFDVHIHFYRRANSNEPVPWAETRRSRVQGVDFHVDPGYSLQDFLDDWTAPHELSHLLIPYVGRRNAWFAEGFASFMQYQVMHELGVLSNTQLDEHYRAQIEKAANNYRMDDTPFAEAAPKLRRRREYPTMYWGGAAYFLRIDHALRQRGSSLLNVLADYVECCRGRSHRLPALVEALDRLAGDKLFSRELEAMKNRPGFPPHADLFGAAG